VNELVTWMADWRHAAPTAVVFVLAPSLLIRLVIRAWPRGDPRRPELLAEFAAIPVPKRLMWVLGVFELAWQEGLPQRREQSVLWPNPRRLPGGVWFGAIAVDVIGIAVVDSRMTQVSFAISALSMLPATVWHVRATYAFADETAGLAEDMANLTKHLEAESLRTPDAWTDATARVAIDARKPLGAPVPHLRELAQAVIDDANRQYVERLTEQYQREMQQIWRDFDEKTNMIEAQLIEDLEREGADEATIATCVGSHRLHVASVRPAR
jgi:hypothetical protein